MDVSWPEIRHPLHQRDGQTGLSRLEIFIINSFIIAMITIVILIIEHPFHQRDEQTELGLEIFITIIIFTIVVFAIFMIICIIIDHLNRLSWIRTQNWNFSDFLKWGNWTTADVKIYHSKIEKMQNVCALHIVQREGDCVYCVKSGWNVSAKYHIMDSITGHKGHNVASLSYKTSHFIWRVSQLLIASTP